MKQEGQEEKSHFSLQVSIILRFIVQEPLVTQKPLSPRVWGSCGEHLGLFLKVKDLAVKVQLTLETGR